MSAQRHRDAADDASNTTEPASPFSLPDEEGEAAEEPCGHHGDCEGSDDAEFLGLEAPAVRGPLASAVRVETDSSSDDGSDGGVREAKRRRGEAREGEVGDEDSLRRTVLPCVLLAVVSATSARIVPTLLRGHGILKCISGRILYRREAVQMRHLRGALCGEVPTHPTHPPR